MQRRTSSLIFPTSISAARERLKGFGLAAEVVRNNGHMAPNDHCCRPTRRGLAVLDYLSAGRANGDAGAKKSWLGLATKRREASLSSKARSAAHKHFALIMSEGSRFPAVIPVGCQNSVVQICKRIRRALGLTKLPVSEAASFPLRKLRAPAIVSLLVAHDSAGDVVRAPKENCWFAGERSIQSRTDACSRRYSFIRINGTPAFA